MTVGELLLKAAESGAERITADKVGDLIDKLAAKIPPPSDDAWQSQIRGMSLDALGKLKNNAPALAGHTREGLAVVLSYAASGNEHEALQAWLRDAAGPADLVGAILTAADAAIADRKAREAALEAAKETGKAILRELGPLAARYLLPLLLQAAR